MHFKNYLEPVSVLCIKIYTHIHKKWDKCWEITPQVVVFKF